ncbi:SdpI family protein [Actinokineospora sp. NPDC004072]
MTLLPLAPLLAGAALLVVGVLGLTGRLPRNRFAGVRTAATLRDDDAFRLGNKVAGLPIAAAGAVGVLGAVAGWLMPNPILACVLALVGLLALTAGGGLLGHRAAAALPEPEPELPAGCKGCQCGGCGVFQRA